MATAFDIEVPDIPANWVALDTVVLLKVLTDEGKVTLCIRASDGIWEIEAVGMLNVALKSYVDDIEFTTPEQDAEEDEDD